MFGNNQLVIPTENGLDILLCKDILRCDADRSHCRFFLVDGREIAVKRSLGFFAPKLAEWNFLRVHKSTMVNLIHVKRYLKGAQGRIVMTDMSEVHVASRKRTDILHLLKVS
jgi:two-component system, LytTR family, response regulator